MSAAKWKLDNLCAFVDVNGLQIDGATAVVRPAEPLDKSLRLSLERYFRRRHDFSQLADALAKAKETKGKPTMILMHTVKGKGVSFMENQAGWHGKAPNAEQYAQAMSELEARVKELEVL